MYWSCSVSGACQVAFSFLPPNPRCSSLLNPLSCDSLELSRWDFFPVGPCPGLRQHPPLHAANDSVFPIFILERTYAESSYTKTRLVIEGESNTVFFAVVSIQCTNQRQQLVTAGTERAAYTIMCLGGEDGGGVGG